MPIIVSAMNWNLTQRPQLALDKITLPTANVALAVILGFAQSAPNRAGGDRPREVVFFSLCVNT